jgi:ubiquinone/menaquinone biosynthesis C-methylase UbiE
MTVDGVVEPQGLDPRTEKETARVQRLWDKTAPKFDKRVSFWERNLFKDGREWVCSQALGNVLEIGVGTGRNLPHYPPDVLLTGIELSPNMLGIAQQRARELGREANLRLGDAQKLEFSNETFDTVVCTLSLCSIPDDARAVAEMHRVLRPGGRALLLEHVRSTSKAVRVFQWLFERVTVPLEGDHQLREPMRHLRARGFEIEKIERYGWGIVERIVARKRARGEAS